MLCAMNDQMTSVASRAAMGNDTAPVAVRWLAVIAGMLAIIATYWHGA